ncbi:hypothetical protein [Brevundimonas goettingensis]|uniref:hypothetical protein n=1 Tax=Brevundimonas goettingensis TaxID=2774190 RepID=UPI0021F10681|nr:hypothetical protein [Brevundimonas goettingensis]
MAADMGASVGRWQGYESGQRIPASRIWQFCRRYGLDVSEIYAGQPFTIGPVGAGGETDSATAPPTVGGLGQVTGEVARGASTGVATGLAPGMAEEATAFEVASGNPHDPASDDAALRAIAEVAADLNPLERNLALAALKGIRAHKANRP